MSFIKGDHQIRRTVIQAEALWWLQNNPAPIGASVVTSLPDISEMSSFNFLAWQNWFVDAAFAIIQWIPDDGVAIFFQSDIRHHGKWVDKGYLIMKAAEQAKAGIIWHKIVCRKPPGTIAMGRASFSHMICVSRFPQSTYRKPGADVLPDAGVMSWSRAMGENACREACRFIRDETPSKIIVDPFCGRGSMLAMANQFGFEAIGVDISPRRCRAAREA